MSEWREHLFEEFLIDSSISYGVVQPGSHSEHESVPIVRVNNIKKGHIITEDVLKIEKGIEEKYKRTRLEGGELLITVVGSVGECAIVPASLAGWNVARAVSVARIREEFDIRFIKYCFNTDDVRFQMYGNTNDTVQPTLNLSSLKALKFLLPPLPEQKAIASVLSSLDDKIDLLHRQNKTLEAMAETLFRQWFQEAAPQPSPQPSPSGRGSEEWKEGKLGDVVTVVSGTTPKTDNPEFWNGDIHWTSPRDITNLIGIFLFDTERKITKRGLEQIGSGLLPANSLLMSSRAPVGALAFSEIPVAINQGYAGIVCNKGYSREFIYLWLKSNMDYVQSHANGSTFQEISKSTFRELDITIPSSDALTEFQKIIGPLFAKIRTNSVQIKTLEKLRDTLLPKLMSGEVRVKV